MIENIIFSTLLNDEDYSRKTLPYLKDEYFTEKQDKVVYYLISRFIEKYNTLPTKDTLLIDLDAIPNLNEQEYDGIKNRIKDLEYEKRDSQWLLDNTEKFCKDKAIYNALVESISIVDGKDTKLNKEAIPEILTKALSVSFDDRIGHDYIENAKDRWEFYHSDEQRIPFDLDIFNKITNGGLLNKTFTLFVAPTGVGKSQIMCHLAAANFLIGKNVLYITLEMSEEQISQRLDANLMGVDVNDFKTMEWESYSKKLERIKRKSPGKIIVHEYPTASASAANIRYLIKDLRLKKNFSPDIIYVDYLNICASSRKKSGNVNSYEYMKSVAEELRGLAVEFDLPIVSATQTNRAGIDNSDIDLTNTSESMGIAHTADLILTLISTTELKEQGQILVKQLKNRYNDLNFWNKFVIGVDSPKMKYYNLDNKSQKEILSEGERDEPVFDGSRSGTRMFEEKPNRFGDFH